MREPGQHQRMPGGERRTDPAARMPAPALLRSKHRNDGLGREGHSVSGVFVWASPLRAATTKVVHAVKGVLAETGRATRAHRVRRTSRGRGVRRPDRPRRARARSPGAARARHLVAGSRRVDRAGRRSCVPSPLSPSCCDVSVWIGSRRGSGTWRRRFPLDTNMCSYRVMGASSTSPVDDGPGEHDVRSAAPHDGAVAAARR